MPNFESIKEIVIQAAMQAATAVIMAFRDTETGPWPVRTPNQWENQRQRNGGLVLEKPRFVWDVSDSYVKLLNFQLEAMNILETRAFEINDEERMQVTKNWLGRDGLLLMLTFTLEKKKKCKSTKGLFSVLSNKFKLHHNHIILSL